DGRAHRGDQGQRPAVGEVAQAQAAVLAPDAHAECPERAQPVDDLAGNARLPLDEVTVEPRLAEAAQPVEEDLLAPDLGRVALGRAGADEVDAQPAEEQLPGETGGVPGGVAG